ncbi:MAG: hypothetical protein PHC88_02700 [Terrimicrobiaceae bacterium]|nr:hypothetical protein [Terrimicrobiaceae bacterium]
MSLLIGVVSRLPGVGDRVRCTANLRGLAVGLSAYLEDQGHWPQQPPFDASQQKEYEDWWIKELKPYDIPEAMWQCPAILRLGKIQQNGRSPRVHYSPTMFDAKPSTPRKWWNMPWLVEIANVHGHGALMILPDGSVHDWDDFVSKYQQK